MVSKTSLARAFGTCARASTLRCVCVCVCVHAPSVLARGVRVLARAACVCSRPRVCSLAPCVRV